MPKNEFGVRISKIWVRIRNQHLQDTICTNFQAKQTALIFSAKTYPNADLGLEIHKANVKISLLEIPSVPIFSQNKKL